MITVDSTARAQAAAVRSGAISAAELLELHLDRIEERNPELNAIISLDAERARASAAVADQALATGEEVGPLHGLPFAVKDTHALQGWRTTYGSPIFADAVVGGMIGGVGQRMLTSVSKRMAGEFFGNVDSAIAGGPVAAAPVPAAADGAPAPAGGTVFTAPATVSAAGSRQEFLTGVAVGAGLVLAGVVVGGIFGRRS